MNCLVEEISIDVKTGISTKVGESYMDCRPMNGTIRIFAEMVMKKFQEARANEVAKEKSKPA